VRYFLRNLILINTICDINKKDVQHVDFSEIVIFLIKSITYVTFLMKLLVYLP
jgi:hypothetical protein